MQSGDKKKTLALNTRTKAIYTYYAVTLQFEFFNMSVCNSISKLFISIHSLQIEGAIHKKNNLFCKFVFLKKNVNTHSLVFIIVSKYNT